MKIRCIALLGFLTLASCFSVEKSRPPSGAFDNFENAYQVRGRDSIVFVSGVFDLKSICLNFRPHTNVKGDCKAYFSEHAGTNADSQEVSLKVCDSQVSANCIDPLPENAPPEVIVIRDSTGNPVPAWGPVDIEVRISKAGSWTGVQVLRIDN